ncbi:Tetratricopeptide repeat-containing protein [Neorhodopirellula lusitana]|uniref:Tetratricopeptide repeat-containing protein n=1 Tax=Neorhodopirellula lusitana TaxID=445327 RepID=A0ABY1QMQ3_9BACT|nr:tetratricopeptide repeat protein [Neorhodopirellula lusitana]SMP72685.1 Tetratricopeptide repeat-containing protein [Neorhodopirellula lusitana]
MPAPALRQTLPQFTPEHDTTNAPASRPGSGLRVVHPDDFEVSVEVLPAEDSFTETEDVSAIGIKRPGLTWSTLVFSFIAGLTFATLSGCQWAAGSQNSQGAAMYNQGQYTAAMEQFQKAIASAPEDPDGYYNLAATTHRLGNQRQDANLIRQSEALYNQCLDHDPDHVDCHRGLAVLLVDSGRPDRAFTLLKNWAAQNPTLSEPRIELARLYEEHGEPQTALKYLEDAVQQDANNPRAWLALARLRESGGDSVQALQNYQRALALGGSSLGNNATMATERVAALSRQLNSAYDVQMNAGGTQIAAPVQFGSTRY